MQELEDESIDRLTVQSYVEMTSAASAGAKEKDEAKQLLAVLMAPANAAVLRIKGMER